MAVLFYDRKGRRCDLNFGAASYIKPLDNRVIEEKYTCSLPFAEGEATRIGIPGVCIFSCRFQVKQDITARFNMENEPEFVEMHFTLEGQGHLLDDRTKELYYYQSNEQKMHYMPGFSGTAEFPKDVAFSSFEVRFDPGYFLSLAGDSSPVLMRFAEKVAAGATADMEGATGVGLPISLDMRTCIRQMMQTNLTGGLRLLYLQSKCTELLSLQAEAYERYTGEAPPSPSRVIRTSHDRDKIHFAGEYLVRHAANPPSLPELARVAGLNEFKLKRGFREIHQNTVFGFLQDYRLQEARSGLQAGDVTIKDMADRLGYSSVQHFTRAFRKKFGITPGQVRN